MDPSKVDTEESCQAFYTTKAYFMIIFVYMEDLKRSFENNPYLIINTGLFTHVYKECHDPKRK